ncbi:uncharacterized protein [Euphorbia lathyris]|uniref:uncharacterized protein n=1 Tax=Euphorbia lathyris TaxID=212925 RepID=UPI00331404AD
MRCKKHPADLTTTVGVCASCLRERLLAIVVAQNHPQHPQLARHHSIAAAAFDDSRKSDAQQPPPPPPPPLLFPRSVSPYVARRKSDGASQHHHLRFYSTPQVGPGSTGVAAFNNSRTFRNKQGRFSLLSKLFRSRSEKFNPDPSASAPGIPSRNSTEAASSSSPSWFSNMFSPQRKKHSTAEYSGVAGRKPRRRMDRGMSPAREADCEEDFQDCDRSPSGSGSSSDSSHWWKRTPVSTTSAVRRGKAGHMSGLAFCLSPLVRASPNRHWNQKGGLPPDMGFPGDIRAPGKPHLSTAASFCANRSRKLCDFGRVNHNR